MAQVIGYHRPTDIDEALALLTRADVRSMVLAGGTNRGTDTGAGVTAVDLQALGLEGISATTDHLHIGAMVRLQDLADNPVVPAQLRELARRELPSTLRSMATVGGTVAAGTWESELLAGLLAFDAVVSFRSASGRLDLPLTEILHGDRQATLTGRIIIEVSVVLDGPAASARTGRTPADTPIVAVVGRRLSDGRVRLALTGVADVPVVVDDLERLQPPADFRGSSEYRRALAIALSARVRAELGA